MAVVARVDTSGVEALFRQVGRDAPRVAMRTINRTLSTGKTAAVRAAAAETALPQKEIRPAIKERKATLSRLEATLFAAARRIPLIRFGAKGPEPSRGRGSGVTYRLPGGKARAPHAFIATMPSGHRGVFRRSALKFMRAQKATWRRKREAIIELRGPSISRALLNTKVAAALRKVVDTALVKNAQHEVKFLLSRRGGGG